MRGRSGGYLSGDWAGRIGPDLAVNHPARVFPDSLSGSNSTRSQVVCLWANNAAALLSGQPLCLATSNPLSHLTHRESERERQRERVTPQGMRLEEPTLYTAHQLYPASSTHQLPLPRPKSNSREKSPANAIVRAASKSGSLSTRVIRDVECCGVTRWQHLHR